MISVGIVGVGYWGSNYIRTFRDHPDCELRWCADLDDGRLAEVKKEHSSVQTTTDYQDLCDDSDLDAVCIATPPATHFELASEFLHAGKDILVEKPFTLTATRAWELAELAQELDRIVLVGHVFEYNQAVRRLQSMIDGGRLGEIYYLHSQRTGLGPIRPDVSALWDLAPHDISTFTYLVDADIESVRCIGRSFLQDVDDSVFLFLEFANGASGFVHCSWLYPSKTRQTTVVGDENMAIFDDTAPRDVLQVYENEVERSESVDGLNQYHFTVRQGDVWLPYVEQREPLAVQVEEFIESVKSRETPVTGPEEGARVVEILECAESSLENGGTVTQVM
jgi:predicted dehydrogenase